MKTNLKLHLFILSNLFYISVLAQDGSLDISFDVDGKVKTNIGTFNDRGNAIAIQSDGKIVVVGQSNNGSQNLFTILKYQTNGTLDTTFGNAGVVFVDFGTSGCVANAVVIQDDGKIVVAGHNNSDFAVARLNENGTLDLSFDLDGLVTTSFGTSSNFESINALVIQKDGKILAVGTAQNGNFDFALARYNDNGSLDTSFDNDGKLITSHPNGLNEYCNAVAIQNDDKIVVAGYISTGSTNDFEIIRYNVNGSFDTTFNFTGKVFTDFGTTQDIANAIKIQSDNKIVVAGSSSNGINSFFALARYNDDGLLDTSLDIDGKLTTAFGTNDATGNALFIQNDTKIIVGGSSGSDFGLARYNNNGTLDITFDTDGKVTTDFDNYSENGLQMAMQTDGKIILVGNSFNDTSTAFALARYTNSSVLKNDMFTQNQFVIYPNPTTHFLGIENQNNIDIKKVKITNLLGESVLIKTANFKTIDVEKLASGIYIIEITTNQTSYQKKFIKQ
jgi:uncharacterized delta-60 repeat protein